MKVFAEEGKRFVNQFFLPISSKTFEKIDLRTNCKEMMAKIQGYLQ